MKDLMFVLSTVLCVVVSCGIKDMGGAVHLNSDGIWTGNPVADPENVCYAVAFDYEDGYDWRVDSEKGTVRCTLILFADGVPVLKMPVGDRYEVSSDAARHRVIAGNLYSDFSDGRTTVVKKNGKEIYRHQGSETVIKMVLNKGHIHTLSYPAEGGGFIYRIDGEVRLQRSEGRLFEHMTVCEDTVTFCFSQSVVTADGEVAGYYQVRNAAVSKLDMKGVSEVWDLYPYNGQIFKVVTYPDDKVPAVGCGDVMDRPEHIALFDVLYCRFLDYERVCANLRGLYVGNSFMMDFLWLEDEGYDSYKFAAPLSAIYVDTQRTYATVNPSDNRQGLIFSGSGMKYMPEGYQTRGRDAIVVADGIMHVALTSMSGGKPLIWRNGKTDTLNINGYVSFLAVHKESEPIGLL